MKKHNEKLEEKREKKEEKREKKVKKPKKGTGTLSDYSKSYETPDQSRNKRMSK